MRKCNSMAMRVVLFHSRKLLCTLHTGRFRGHRRPKGKKFAGQRSMQYLLFLYASFLKWFQQHVEMEVQQVQSVSSFKDVSLATDLNVPLKDKMTHYRNTKSAIFWCCARKSPQHCNAKCTNVKMWHQGYATLMANNLQVIFQCPLLHGTN